MGLNVWLFRYQKRAMDGRKIFSLKNKNKAWRFNQVLKVKLYDMEDKLRQIKVEHNTQNVCVDRSKKQWTKFYQACPI